MLGRGRKPAALLAVVALAVLARLVTCGEVVGGDGLVFPGNDPYYHLIRAERTVRDYPSPPAFDRRMNHPVGAEIIWPPLFDHLIATTAMVATGGHADRESVAWVAAIVPIPLGVLTVVLIFFAARRCFGQSIGIRAALVIAILPAHVMFSAFGQADQHVAEALFLSLILLAFLESMSAARGRRRLLYELLLGAGIALSFWNWMGSALYLLLLNAFVGTWHVLAPPADPQRASAARALTRGGLIASVAMVASVALLGADGSLTRLSFSGITSLHIVFVIISTAYAGALWWFATKPQTVRRRCVEVMSAAGASSAAAFLVIPGLWDALRPGLTALGRTSAWYENIKEYDPLIFGGFSPVASELWQSLQMLGLGLLVAPIAAVLLVRKSSPQPRHFAAPILLLLWGAALIALALTRQRFVLYLAIPLSIWIAIAWEWIEAWVRRTRLLGSAPAWVSAILVGAVLLGPAACWYRDRAAGVYAEDPGDLIQVLQWLRQESSAVPDDDGVLAEWNYGHFIQYYADKPVLTNPFGIEAGSSMDDSAAFFLATSSAQAEAILTRRKIGFVLLTNPLTEVHFAYDLAQPGTPRTVRVTPRPGRGPHIEVTPAFWELDVSRLYFVDGMVPAGNVGEALGAYRLLYESSENKSWAGHTTAAFKVFGVVLGARLEIATTPGAIVRATTIIETNQGRTVSWSSTTQANGQGRARLRLPYATGDNGAVTAGPYTLSYGRAVQEVRILENQVVQGAEVSVAF